MRMTDSHDDSLQKNELEPAPVETRADSARVHTAYQSLDAEATKKAYAELSSVLDGFARTVIHTLDQMVPYLAAMQSLLSQRGADRKKVLTTAGLPGWTAWAKAYAAKFECSVRTIQEHINLFRTAKKDGGAGRKGKGLRNDNKLRLDYRQQSALVKAQLAANGIVDALKNGGDWQTPMAEYDKVAVTPAKLNSFVNALNQETDWQDVLTRLVAKLEQVGDRLPMPIITEMRSVSALLEGKKSLQVPAQQAATASNGASTLEYKVKEWVKDKESTIYFAVIQRGRKKPYELYETRSEAESVCESLNTSPVASRNDDAA